MASLLLTRKSESHMSGQCVIITECGCLLGGVIENDRTRNPLTLWTVHGLVHVRVWVHALGNPQSVQLRIDRSLFFNARSTAKVISGRSGISGLSV